MRILTEKQLEDLLFKAMDAGAKGTLNWICSDNVWLKHKTTGEKLGIKDGYVIDFDDTVSPFREFILPELENRGIKIT